jgi:hypothetical protein
MCFGDRQFPGFATQADEGSGGNLPLSIKNGNDFTLANAPNPQVV